MPLDEATASMVAPSAMRASMDLDSPLDPNSLVGELSRLEEAVVRLDFAFTAQSMRLDHVLLDESTVAQKREERDHATPLAMRVRAVADNIEDIADSFQRLTNRIDL